MLTNGQWRHRRSDSPRFVELIAGAGAVAIGFGLQEPGTRTPPDLVAACEEAGVPLFEIPHDMAFGEISEYVATSYAQQGQRRLVRRLRRDEALLSSVTGGAGIDETLRVLAHDHGLDLLLVDHAGQTLGSTVRGDAAPAAPALAAAVAGVTEPAGSFVDGDPVTVFPVAAHGDVEAFLICLRPIDQVAADERSAIGHGLVFVGLELSHALATRELTERLVDELPNVIAGGDARAAELAGRLRSLGVDPGRPITAIALVPEAPAAAGVARRVARLTMRLLAARGIPAVAPIDGSTVIVVAVLEAGARELAELLVGALAREGCPVCAGVGSLVAPGSRDVRQSVGEARLAADFARHRGGEHRVATSAEAGSYRVLLAGQDADACMAFAEAVLGPVLEQDRQRGTQLVESLDAFLRDGGHWQRVADGLHLHVNTLRYRIGRVEQLTGRPLSSFEERVNFFLALEALREGAAEARLEDPPN